jgi:hypothetical protein
MAKTSRRNFIRGSFLLAGGALLVPSLEFALAGCSGKKLKKIRLASVSSAFESEPLVRPFGFKGSYMNEMWQVASFLKSVSGEHAVGLGTQNVLWSDAAVFASHSESVANALMYSLTDKAIRVARSMEFTSPVELFDVIYPEVYEAGKKITGNPALKKTFALNALVSVDNAAWLLFAKENHITNFDDLIPAFYKPALSQHHEKVAAVQLMSYNLPVPEIRAAADLGYFFMKIRLGQPGTQDEMLEKDMARMTEIHAALGNLQTTNTRDGKVPYYLDANGRYEKKETLNRFLDHAKEIGALDHIVLIEEPFPEEAEIDVSDIPVRLSADESAHDVEGVLKRIQMGYRAVALKPAAKTLSMTMKMAQACFEKNIPCYCADLTVNPVLVEWNKNVAARLMAFPGLENMGLLESNGPQNYKNWNAMLDYLPDREASWIHPKDGTYNLGKRFFRNGGGIFEPVQHFEEMFAGK